MLRKRIVSSLLILTIILSTSSFAYADDDPGGDSNASVTTQSESVSESSEESPVNGNTTSYDSDSGLSDSNESSSDSQPPDGNIVNDAEEDNIANCEPAESNNISNTDSAADAPSNEETQAPTIKEEDLMNEYFGPEQELPDEQIGDQPENQVDPDESNIPETDASVLGNIIDFFSPQLNPVDTNIESGVLEDAIAIIENSSTGSALEITSDSAIGKENDIVTESAVIVSEPAIEAPVYKVLYEEQEDRAYSSMARFTAENTSNCDKTYTIRIIENIGYSPYIVPYNKYNETEWRNLNTEDTLNNISIGVEIDGLQYWYDGSEEELLYMEAGSKADIKLLFQHGNSWTVNYELKYRIVLDAISGDEDCPETIEVISEITAPNDIEIAEEIQTGEDNGSTNPVNDNETEPVEETDPLLTDSDTQEPVIESQEEQVPEKVIETNPSEITDSNHDSISNSDPPVDASSEAVDASPPTQEIDCNVEPEVTDLGNVE